MKTVFIRALEAPSDQKATVVRAAVLGPNPVRFELDPSSLASIPKSPFGYWVREVLRNQFGAHPQLESEGREACSGATTNDDPRFLRLWCEVPSDAVARSREETSSRRWCPLAKGGQHATYYADIYLVVDWGGDGQSVKAHISEYRGRRGWGFLWSAALNGHEHYFRPGLTWSRRSQKGLSLRVLPAGGLFGDKGPVVLADDDDSQELLILSAILNSRPFRELVAAQMAFGSYEVGVLERTPIPSNLVSRAIGLEVLARNVWSGKRRLDTRTETSHAFWLPALLQVDGDSLVRCAQSWAQVTATREAELDELAAQIDGHAYRLYGISAEDRQHIERGFAASDVDSEAEPEDEGDADEEVVEVDTAPMVASLLSWSLGVAFGRFDVRLATGERAELAEPEPFDPLPVCSPGMLTGDDGLPVAAPPSGYPLIFPNDGILVDDPGHPRDVVRAVRSVFDTIFDDANARWHEAAELLGAPDLRTWFARDFFEPHIKRYSKSRRKAPIYWQLATASGSYSVWLYIHRATGDTLFRVLNDFVGPKLDHEKAKLDGLTREAGANPSAAQRREIEQQETFVGELQALKTEVARVAPLWKPNLDDGVILNFAPLWRLVPQSRSWQGECKKAWDKLQSGDYDWAHLAMHLWPERVVPKCIDDRSLAIAHGLEDVFWHEDESGAWRKSQVDDATMQKLVRERTSATVKAALKDLLSAATPVAGKGRRQGSGGRVRGAGRTPVARTQSTDTVDEATLNAVKAAIATVAGGASKADVLAATGLSDTDWSRAIATLLDRGEVTRSGEKRGVRYHCQGLSHA